MDCPFLEANLYVYNRGREAVFDVVIWCLGPLVDDGRDYGVFRIYLAAVTRSLCRGYLHVRTWRPSAGN